VLRAAPPRSAKRRVFVPFGSDPADSAALRAQGYATVTGLEPQADDAAEARRLHCNQMLKGGSLVALVTE